MDAELEKIKQLKMARMRQGVAKEDENKGKPQVTVYSTPTCPYCHMAKRYLMDRKIEFRDIDLSNPANQEEGARMMQATGQTGVPQLNINGQWIVGFDRNAIDEALGIPK